MIPETVCRSSLHLSLFLVALIRKFFVERISDFLHCQLHCNVRLYTLLIGHKRQLAPTNSECIFCSICNNSKNSGYALSLCQILLVQFLVHLLSGKRRSSSHQVFNPARKINRHLRLTTGTAAHTISTAPHVSAIV